MKKDNLQELFEKLGERFGQIKDDFLKFTESEKKTFVKDLWDKFFAKNNVLVSKKEVLKFSNDADLGEFIRARYHSDSVPEEE